MSSKTIEFFETEVHCIICAGKTYTYPDIYIGCVCKKNIRKITNKKSSITNNDF